MSSAAHTCARSRSHVNMLKCSPASSTTSDTKQNTLQECLHLQTVPSRFGTQCQSASVTLQPPMRPTTHFTSLLCCFRWRHLLCCFFHCFYHEGMLLLVLSDSIFGTPRNDQSWTISWRWCSRSSFQRPKLTNMAPLNLHPPSAGMWASCTVRATSLSTKSHPTSCARKSMPLNH